LETPADRPITYGLFILLTSFHAGSLFFTVIFQNLLLSFLLLECFIKCCGKSGVNRFLLVLLPLAFLTGLCWVSNQIFSDMFTSVIFLSAFLILTSENENRSKRALLYFIFLFSVGMHLSHITITQLFLYPSLVLAAFIIPRSLDLQKNVVVKRGIALIAIGFSAILIMGAAISKSSPIFFTGKLCENGILKKYLDEHCEKTNYKLCAYKEELSGAATDFIWNGKGVTSKLGGWNTIRAEYESIDKAILKDPKYMKLFVSESMKSSLQQFTLNRIGEGNSHLINDSNNATAIGLYFPHEYGLFAASEENSIRGINFAGFNSLYAICYILFTALFLVLFVRKTILRQFDITYLFAFMAIAGITANNILAASLANAVNRFGVRVYWLLVFATIIMVAELLKNVRQTH
jgi:hypothetical protein